MQNAKINDYNLKWKRARIESICFFFISKRVYSQIVNDISSVFRNVYFTRL